MDFSEQFSSNVVFIDDPSEGMARKYHSGAVSGPNLETVEFEEEVTVVGFGRKSKELERGLVDGVDSGRGPLEFLSGHVYLVQ